MEYNVKPHGGKLVDLFVSADEAEQKKSASQGYISLTLTQRQLCDLELLVSGAFSPLNGFMDQNTYQSVIEHGRLPDQLLWPIPITLDVNQDLAEKVKLGDQIALRDAEGFMPAILKVSDVWKADKQMEAESIYGTDSILHPGVDYLLNQTQDFYIGGEISAIELPTHFEFENLWSTPEELRSLFNKRGWRNVIAFQTSKPMHRVHREITLNAARDVQAHILIHPTVGITKPGDLHYYSRIHCYQAIKKYYPDNLAIMSLLPLAMRMAGPKEALWHAIINKNYGCSHMLVGPEHAFPPKTNGTKDSFYPHNASQDYLSEHEKELDIKTVAVEETHYVPSKNKFLPVSAIQEQRLDSETLSEQELKNRLHDSKSIPAWFSYPEVLQALSKAYPAK